MKTSRDIKTSLDLARTKSAPCRTTRIEEQIKKDLLSTRGSFLSEGEVERIEQKEERRIKKQVGAITKARVNILRQKERTKVVQAVRNGSHLKKSAVSPPVATIKKPRTKWGGFNAIDVGY
jgi:hypothetical protein